VSETGSNQPSAPAAAGFIAAGRTVDAGRGWDWIASGFRLFMKQPGMWILLLIVLVPTILIMGGGSFLAMMHGDMARIAALGLTFLLAMLVMLGLSIPVYMAIWFAPALVVLNNLKPVAALQASFFACLKNFIPFLVYGVIGLVLGVIAGIPLMLGFLVLGPVFLASIYTAYRDIFFPA